MSSIPKSFFKITLPIILSATMSCSQYNKQDSIIPYSLKDIVHVETFIAKDFNANLGGIVYANKEEGLKNLVEKAKNDSKESSWAFLPEHDIWINTLYSVGEAYGKNDVGLVEYLFDNFKKVEFWHTHTDSEYNSWYSLNEIESFGQSLYFIPTNEDVVACIQNTMNFPDNDLLTGIVSSKGCLEMKSPKMEWNFTSPYVIQGFRDFCRTEFTSIREKFRGTPFDSLEIKAREYDRNINLKYIGF